MRGPVFVHIGLAKTGTTTLQQDVFSKAPGIAYLGKNLVPAPLDEARRGITRAPDGRFDAPAARAAFDAYRQGGQGVALFSDEDLSVWKFRDPEVMGARIAAVFPDNRVIYVTRRPRDWAVSQYFFRLSTWRPDTMDGLNPWLERHLATLEVGSDVAEVRFAETLRRFLRGAGGPPLLVLPYEMMASDIAGFLGAIEGFMGLDGELRALAPAAAGTPRKPRIGHRMADFHRSLGLAARDRGGFLQLASILAKRGLVEHRRRFALLAADPSTPIEDWRDWLSDIDRRVGRALGQDDAELAQALDRYGDYEIRPDLLARIDEITVRETRAMRDEFGIDLAPWGYA